jgi:hypothetical protein
MTTITTTTPNLIITSLTNNTTALSNGSNMIISSGVLGNGQILIGRAGNTPAAASITGTTNQITVSLGSGTIGLNLPQNIATTSNPTFNNLTISSLLQAPSAGGNFSNQTAVANTLNTQSVPIFTITPSTLVAYNVKVQSTFNNGGTSFGFENFTFTIRNATSTPVISTKLMDLRDVDSALSAAVIAPNVIGSTVQIDVTGVASSSINWVANISILSI